MGLTQGLYHHGAVQIGRILGLIEPIYNYVLFYGIAGKEHVPIPKILNIAGTTIRAVYAWRAAGVGIFAAGGKQQQTPCADNQQGSQEAEMMKEQRIFHEQSLKSCLNLIKVIKKGNCLMAFFIC